MGKQSVAEERPKSGREGAEARAWGAWLCGAVPRRHASPSACPSRDSAFPGPCREPDACLHAFNPNRSSGNRKHLRSNCRSVQCTGKNRAPCLVLPARPAPWSGNVYPPATERGRSILHRYSIAMASLPDMMTGNKPGSRQHPAGIERPGCAVLAVSRARLFR